MEQSVVLVYVVDVNVWTIEREHHERTDRHLMIFIQGAAVHLQKACARGFLRIFIGGSLLPSIMRDRSVSNESSSKQGSNLIILVDRATMLVTENHA